jgi:transposase
MKERTKVCGIDVHKEFLQACVLSRSGETSFHRFRHNHDGILALKDLVLGEECEVVAFESTGVYWYKLYLMLEQEVPVIVANAYQIKNIPGRKTDIKDSQWIAELTLNGLIKPSRIFPRRDREFRDLTRNREILVRTKATFKNRVHKILDGSGIKLKPLLKDIFGKSGRHILDGIATQQDCETILSTIPSPVIKRKSEDIREVLRESMSPLQLQLLRTQLAMLDEVDKKISEIDSLIIAALADEQYHNLSICSSVPGIGITAGVTILAEIGDYNDFPSGDRLASWTGLAPSVYQSANKLITGKITKRGSTHLRWILVQVAQAASRSKNTILSRFFQRIAYRRGRNIAIIALARKILCILWHLLQKRETYSEPDLKKKTKCPAVQPLRDISIDDAVVVLNRAGFRIFTSDSTELDLKGVSHFQGPHL